MLEELFERDFYLQKHLNAPMLKERDDFLQYMSEQGTALYRLKLIADYLLRIVEYLQLEDGRMVTHKEIEDTALKWGKSITNHHMKRAFSKSGQSLFARYAKYWLERLNRLVPLAEEPFALLKELYEIEFTLKRHLEAPLLQERISYLQYMRDNGVKSSDLKSMASFLLRINEMLQPENKRIVTLKEVCDAASQWALSCNHPVKKHAYSVSGRNRFKKSALDWLGWLGQLEQPPEEKYPLLHQLFKVRHALMRHIEAPLLDERILYLEHRREQGVKLSSLHHEANLLLVIMHNLDFYSFHPVTISQVRKMGDKWSKSQVNAQRTGIYTHRNKLLLRHIAKIWLSMFNCLIDDEYRPIFFQKELDDYLYHQLKERGLSENTIKTQAQILKNYLTIIHKKSPSLKLVTPFVMDEIIAGRCSAGLSRGTIRGELIILRSFFSYLAERDGCKVTLSNSIRIPRAYSHESLPSAPQWDDVKTLVSKCQLETPAAIRDYAILLLLIVYGLRGSEIAGLQLDDLDWREELIHIKRAKRGKPQTFPLAKTVGNAIIRYLREVRPNESTLREVFLTMIAPYRPLNTLSIHQIVNRLMKPMNLSIRNHGPHSLRHASATHLINTGFSLKEISDYLGHQNIETTRIYTKVDLTSLLKVADMNWESIL